VVKLRNYFVYWATRFTHSRHFSDRYFTLLLFENSLPIVFQKIDRKNPSLGGFDFARNLLLRIFNRDFDGISLIPSGLDKPLEIVDKKIKKSAYWSFILANFVLDLQNSPTFPCLILLSTNAELPSSAYESLFSTT
jgi:hypothetical protein